MKQNLQLTKGKAYALHFVLSFSVLSFQPK